MEPEPPQMQVASRYALLVFIWSTTPLAVVLSIRELHPVWALALRFALAAPLAADERPVLGWVEKATLEPWGIETRSIVTDYIDKVFSFIDRSTIRPFDVVLDAGSGMAGLVAPLLFDQLPCTTTRLVARRVTNAHAARPSAAQAAASASPPQAAAPD